MDEPSSREVFANRWLTVREDVVRRSDGSVGTHTVVDGGNIVLVVPVDGDRVHLVEQHRHPVGGRRWEFPSGGVEQLDADERSVAVRELREETGLSAGVLTRLGTLDVTPSTMTQRCAVFLTTDLTEGPPERDPEEVGMRSAWVSRDELRQMVRAGTFCDSKSLAAYAMLLTSERGGLPS